MTTHTIAPHLSTEQRIFMALEAPMTDARIARIRETIDHIRQDILKPGYVVRAQTTLRTCPADMNRIAWQLDAIERDLAAGKMAATETEGE